MKDQTRSIAKLIPVSGPVSFKEPANSTLPRQGFSLGFDDLVFF
jgi:hypothetical protein